MPTGITNAKSRQYAIRLPHEIDDRLSVYMKQHSFNRSEAIVSLLSRALGVPRGPDTEAGPGDCARPTEAAVALVDR